LEKLQIVGFCSHLASSDEESALNQKQLDNFLNGLDILHSHGYYPQYVHLGNSAAIFTMSDKRLTAFRSGLALYGYNPLDINHQLYSEASKLQPALRLISTIVSIQIIKKGETVSYNEAYLAEEDTKIAVIPFGYYEGLSRNFSNQAEFTCYKNNHKYLLKVAGKVCMNLCCLNILDYNIKIGDKVEIISWNTEDKNSISNLSKIAKQIPYDFLVKIQGNIRREIV
jgi:alanine racemase